MTEQQGEDGRPRDRVPADFPEIMNAEELAAMLRVSKQTVYDEASSGRLPGRRVGRAWRFHRDAILAHIASFEPDIPLPHPAAS